MEKSVLSVDEVSIIEETRSLGRRGFLTSQIIELMLYEMT